MEVSALTTSMVRGRHGGSPLLRMQPDEHLIKLARGGYDIAFEVLVDRYETRLLAFCRHMLGSREDAEDVLQEVFSSAYGAIHADGRPINARPWLYRIARNRCLNHLRRVPAIGVDSMDVLYAGFGATTADRVQEREEFRLLVHDIRELPETQRTALILREMDALSYDQIAEAMETSVSSVKSLLVRARMSLTDAADARLLSCVDVRRELVEATEGIIARPRASVRRHLRSCEACAGFQGHLKQTNRALAALLPLGPLGIWRVTRWWRASGGLSHGAAGAGLSAVSTKAAVGLAAVAAIATAGVVTVATVPHRDGSAAESRVVAPLGGAGASHRTVAGARSGSGAAALRSGARTRSVVVNGPRGSAPRSRPGASGQPGSSTRLTTAGASPGGSPESSTPGSSTAVRGIPAATGPAAARPVTAATSKVSATMPAGTPAIGSGIGSTASTLGAIPGHLSAGALAPATLTGSATNPGGPLSVPPLSGGPTSPSASASAGSPATSPAAGTTGSGDRSGTGAVTTAAGVVPGVVATVTTVASRAPLP